MRVSSWNTTVFSVDGGKSKIPQHGYNKNWKKAEVASKTTTTKKYAVALATDNLDEAKKYSGLLCGWHV